MPKGFEPPRPVRVEPLTDGLVALDTPPHPGPMPTYDPKDKSWPERQRAWLERNAAHERMDVADRHERVLIRTLIRVGRSAPQAVEVVWLAMEHLRVARVRRAPHPVSPRPDPLPRVALAEAIAQIADPGLRDKIAALLRPFLEQSDG